VEFLLAEGGPELLAENLSMLVEHARPRDWLTAKIAGGKTVVPWSLRIHDVGEYPDFRNIPSTVPGERARPRAKRPPYTNSARYSA